MSDLTLSDIRTLIQNELKGQINPGPKIEGLDDFCRRFPGLCETVGKNSEVLGKMAQAIEELKKEPEVRTGPIHKDAKSYILCDECSGPLLTATGKLAKEDKAIGERVYNIFKQTGALGVLNEFAEEEKKRKAKEEGKKPEKLIVI